MTGPCKGTAPWTCCRGARVIAAKIHRNTRMFAKICQELPRFVKKLPTFPRLWSRYQLTYIQWLQVFISMWLRGFTIATLLFLTIIIQWLHFGQSLQNPLDTPVCSAWAEQRKVECKGWYLNPSGETKAPSNNMIRNIIPHPKASNN